MFHLQSNPILIVTALLAGLAVFTAQPALAHCDTLDGPVVADAHQALAVGDVTPVLKWTQPSDEQEIREVFAHALRVRAISPEAQELADRFFFETLVRLHRAGEGAPYTGLKPAGQELSPAVMGADAALDSANIEALEELLTGAVTDGMRDRFAAVLAAKPHAADSVTAGRDYVAAYVSFVHYVENLERAAGSAGGHEHEGAADSAGPAAHAAAAGHQH